MKMRRDKEDLNLTFPLLWTNSFSNRLAWRAQGMLAGLGAVITLWVGRKGRGKFFMISWKFGQRRGLSKWSATELGVGLRLDLEEETRKEEVKLVTYAIYFPGWRFFCVHWELDKASEIRGWIKILVRQGKLKGNIYMIYTNQVREVGKAIASGLQVRLDLEKRERWRFVVSLHAVLASCCFFKVIWVS